MKRKKAIKAENLEQQMQEIDKIATNAVMQWSEDQAVSSFFKKQLGEEYEKEGISTAQKLFKASVSKAIVEEKPEWTAMLFSNAAKGEEKTASTNVQVNIGSFLDNLKE
jgi:hypothetical protein